jgi:hypothetical protein
MTGKKTSVIVGVNITNDDPFAILSYTVTDGKGNKTKLWLCGLTGHDTLQLWWCKVLVWLSFMWQAFMSVVSCAG